MDSKIDARIGRRRMALGLLLACGLALGGCQAAYFLTDPDKEKEVKAEYSKIGSRKVAVVVWADQAMLDMYPRVRYQVAKAAAYYMQKHLSAAKFVDADEVRKMQTGEGADWENMSAKDVSRRLSCDLVLRIDLLDFTTRASETRELRKGRIRGVLNLYEGGQEARDDAAYNTDVVVTYPPASVHGTVDLDDEQIIHETVELFAQTVAEKFYDHGESLRGPENR